MAKGKWFKEGAECWVYSTLEIDTNPITHLHWVSKGYIKKIGRKWTEVVLNHYNESTPFLTDSEVFYSLGQIRRRYGNDFEIRDEKWN